MTVEVLSAQEQAIESGDAVTHGKVTERVLRLYNAVRAYGPPRANVERAVLFTESFKETEGHPCDTRFHQAVQERDRLRVASVHAFWGEQVRVPRSRL